MTYVGRWSVRTVAVLGLAAGTAVAARAQESGYRLTLGDAARLGAERSATVQQARSRVEAAEARIRERTGDLLPTLDADVLRGARTFNTASFGLDFPTAPGQEPFFDPAGEVVGPVRSADVRARVEMPLLDLAALGRRKGAQAGAVAAEEEMAALKEVAGAAAARAYVGVLRGRAEVDAREQDLALGNELLGVARDQLEAGVAVALDVTRAEAQVATVRAQLLAARHRAQVAELALRRTLRLGDDVPLELADDLGETTVGDVPDEGVAVSAAMGQRGDLRTAEAYRSVAEESLATVKAGRLPKLTVGLDDGYYGKGFGGMLNTYSWTFRLSLPVFDGFQRSAQIQEEQARARELDYRIEDLQADVEFQVRQAILNLNSAQEQVSAADERLRLAELEVAQEEDRLRAGVAGTA
ncbi:MAG TPA: TolC family protein, partial [Longimicrobiales bacterium]|nr:TolC family protein [Longimicrobiales bacterium]